LGARWRYRAGVPRFSLYIHIPYCQAKCPYCDFNSYAVPRWPEARYVAALCAELRHYAQELAWRNGEIGTIFFGGGTPSLFAPASIGRIVESVAARWAVAPDVEITLEANPGTVTREKLAALRAAGVNRMSFGVQSFLAHHLERLGRIHSAADAMTAVRWAQDVGFANVSLDLIYALPHQTLAEWEHDLGQACALRPDHVSAYNLTYEEGTPFHHWRGQGLLRQLPEEIEVAMFTRTQELLHAAGYEQYEISNYARPGRPCRHNLNYWRSGAYLGVGAGAHSYRRGEQLAGGDWGARWSNEKNPNAYMDAVEQRGHARGFCEALDLRQARGEFVFLALRCREGFDEAVFHARFGLAAQQAFPHIGVLCDDGLLERAHGWCHLTPRGLLLADSVFATFL
jgi:oxygen-independent coproporphyrinogen III oxidase